ncbi:MAG: hypothetical protein KC415_14685 [Anaerolineales bacterium]|nr:hypothetical protein [Anaerolineales bacterium]
MAPGLTFCCIPPPHPMQSKGRRLAGLGKASNAVNGRLRPYTAPARILQDNGPTVNYLDYFAEDM